MGKPAWLKYNAQSDHHLPRGLNGEFKVAKISEVVDFDGIQLNLLVLGLLGYSCFSAIGEEGWEL